jgi:hypothetical protein
MQFAFASGCPSLARTRVLSPEVFRLQKVGFPCHKHLHHRLQVSVGTTEDYPGLEKVVPDNPEDQKVDSDYPDPLFQTG